MPDILDPAERLNRLLDLEEARIATIFRTAVSDLQGELDLDELADLIEAGRLEDAFDKLRHTAERLGAASNVTFISAGQDAAEFLSRAGVGRIVFDVVSETAVAAMQANRLQLIREFTDEQRRATSLALISGVEAGTNPRAAARNFRQSIGLTTRQWGAVANYRRALEAVGTDDKAFEISLQRELRDRRSDGSIRRAIAANKPLPRDRVDRLVDHYANRYIRYRSEVIGRTEALRSVHEGTEETYRQAIAAGHIEAEQLRRSWQTRIDGRERDTHLLLHGQVRRWGEAWETKNGPIRYPGDPDAPAVETIQCRCALATRILAV